MFVLLDFARLDARLRTVALMLFLSLQMTLTATGWRLLSVAALEDDCLLT